jgi:hypothetical protein
MSNLRAGASISFGGHTINAPQWQMVKLHEDYMGIIWGLYGDYMGIIWRLYGDYMKIIWRLYGDDMGMIWGIHGKWYQKEIKKGV